MNNKRQLIRLDVDDFLDIRVLDEQGNVYIAKTKNISAMGICFSSQAQFKKSQVLLIDYFVSAELDSIRLKMLVIWNEFIDPSVGYFTGGEIVEIEEEKKEKFSSYYYKKLNERR